MGVKKYHWRLENRNLGGGRFQKERWHLLAMNKFDILA